MNMNTSDLILYASIACAQVLVAVLIVRSIKNARRVRTGFNGGVCADCLTRWHVEYSWTNEEYGYVCKCGKHSLPVSRFVTCDVIPEPTAETLEDAITCMVAGNSVEVEVGHRMRLLVQKIPQDQVFDNLHLFIREGGLVLQGRSGNCMRQLRITSWRLESDADRADHVAYYDAEGPQEFESGVFVTAQTVETYLQRVLFAKDLS